MYANETRSSADYFRFESISGGYLIPHSSALLVYDWHYIVLLGAILTQLRTDSKATMRLNASDSSTATA